MVRWLRRCFALRSDVSEDFGGDELGGLSRYVEKPRRADALLGSTSAGCRVRRWLATC